MNIKYEIWLSDVERWFCWELFRLEKYYLTSDLKKHHLPFFIRKTLFVIKAGLLCYDWNPRLYEKLKEVDNAKTQTPRPKNRP